MMKKTFFYAFVIFIAFTIISCGTGSNEADLKNTGDSVPELTADVTET